MQSNSLWRQYKVDFDDVKQKGLWGTSYSFDPSKLMSIHFRTDENVNYNFSIDNLAFYGPDGVTNEDTYAEESNTGPSDRNIFAGFRASEYGFGGAFISADGAISVGNDMTANFPGSTPAAIWNVGQAMSDGECQLNFPGEGTNIQGGATDRNEAHLTYFDQHGLKVILQVEPNMGTIDQLIEAVLETYYLGLSLIITKLFCPSVQREILHIGPRNTLTGVRLIG